MENRKTQDAEPNGGERSEETQMADYGIRRVPVDHFVYREFRYTNLRDALAQAIRDRQAE